MEISHGVSFALAMPSVNRLFYLVCLSYDIVTG